MSTGREKKVLGENLPQCNFIWNVPHVIWPAIEPRPSQQSRNTNLTFRKITLLSFSRVQLHREEHINIQERLKWIYSKFLHWNWKTWFYLARFEVFTAVTMKNAVFWDMAPCRSCMNRRFGGIYRLHLQCRKSSKEERAWVVAAHAGPSFVDVFLRNVGSHKIYTAPQPRSRHSSWFYLN
jgi:hypothetical protein